MTPSLRRCTVVGILFPILTFVAIDLVRVVHSHRSPSPPRTRAPEESAVAGVGRADHSASDGEDFDMVAPPRYGIPGLADLSDRIPDPASEADPSEKSYKDPRRGFIPYSFSDSSPVAQPPGTSMPALDGGQYQTVTVFFGTNRERSTEVDGTEFFGNRRGTLSYGHVEVSIPNDHEVGSLGTIFGFRSWLRDDPETRVSVLQVVPHSAKSFYDLLHTNVGASGRKSILVFIHGFNVHFSDAARRTAQLAYDLNFDGVPMFFSWPSMGSWTPSAYIADRETADWSAATLATFLKELHQRSGASEIHLFAHSMGTRVLTRALEVFETVDATQPPPFHEIVLAAPDIDAEFFRRDLVPRITPKVHHMTLYASRQDFPLEMSGALGAGGYRRAGLADPLPVIASGVDSIDASAVVTDFWRHFYYGESRAMIMDLSNIFNGRLGVSARTYLRKKESPSGRYWEFPR
jgi:esterase/lipase superfamily enzyme